MELRWYRQDPAAVIAALQQGARPDMVTSAVTHPRRAALPGPARAPQRGAGPLPGTGHPPPAWLGPVQISQGSNARHPHPAGRQAESLPCHPDVLRDTLRRVDQAGWLELQRAGVGALYRQRLVRGGLYAIDGGSLGPALR